MSQKRILIFIPTFNERGNVERMAQELSALDLDADILFLDDNSPDGTGSVLDHLSTVIPRVAVIHRTGKQGIGSAHKEGIRIAYERGYDLLITLDCDFTHDPCDIPRMIEALDQHDMTVGSRYMRQDSLPGWNIYRRVLTIFGHFLTKYLLGIPQDASGAFRVYNLSRIPQELFSLVTSQSYSFFFESLLVLVRNRVSVAEVPIVLPARTYGSSKLTLREAARGGFYLLRIWLETLSHPERFLLGRKPDRMLAEAQDAAWDAYWAKKSDAAALVYDLIAATYRKLFIRPNLHRALRKAFPERAALLHAGCGSGQADCGLHSHFDITAVDISPEALALYGRMNPDAKRIEQADLFALPFADDSFDGVFNLGVMEHFTEQEIIALLAEMRRVLKPSGKVVFFWPHAKATSVFVLKAVHKALAALRVRTENFHPDEITLINNKSHAFSLLEQAGLTPIGYHFGSRDLFIQAIIIGRNS